MAEDPSLTMDRRLQAGRDYLIALRKLGFSPDVLCWARAPGGDESFQLLLVTTWADSVGAKAIYDLLFEAYDAAATPKEIDPFIVTVFSPKSRLGADLVGMIHAADKMKEHTLEARPILVLGMVEYATMPNWVLACRRPQSTQFEDVRRFSAFQRNVELLAAA